MRRIFPVLLGSILLGIFFLSTARAQEQPSARRRFDIGLAPSVGYFLYPQYVDGGYYIGGEPYDLVWSGLQLQLSGDFHWYFPNHPSFGLGGAGAFMVAPNATGADWADTVNVDPDQSAFGGYFAVSACFRPNDRWRLMAQTGYGGNGISAGGKGFGGWGFVLGLAAHRMFGRGALASGVGLRLNSMVLSTPGDDSTRGEWGVYNSLSFEVLFEAAPRRIQ